MRVQAGFRGLAQADFEMSSTGGSVTLRLFPVYAFGQLQLHE